HPGRALIDLPLEIDAAASRPAEHCRAARSGKRVDHGASEARKVTGNEFAGVPVAAEVTRNEGTTVAVEMEQLVGEAKRVLLVRDRHAARAVDHPLRRQSVADLGVHRGDLIDGGSELTNGVGFGRETTRTTRLIGPAAGRTDGQRDIIPVTPKAG